MLLTDPSRAAAVAQNARQESEYGRAENAIALWEEAITLDPRNMDHAFQLTNYLIKFGQYRQASAICETILSTHDDLAPIWLQNGCIKYNYLSDKIGAVADFNRALLISPDDPHIHELLVESCQAIYDFEQMRRHAHAAIKHADLRTILRIQCRFLADYPAAIAVGREVINNNPADVDSLILLGRAYYMENRLDEALGVFARALEHQPNKWDAICPFADLLVLFGDHRAGWKRWEQMAHPAHIRATNPFLLDYMDKKWSGQTLEGKSIVVLRAAMIGDNLLAARYARDLKAAGAHVIFVCRPELDRLLQGLEGADEVTPHWPAERWGEVDYWVFDALLPAYFGAAEGRIPAYPQGYLGVQPELSFSWAERLQEGKGRLKVGICWHTNPSDFWGVDRSIPLDALKPLFEIEAVDFYVVQKNISNAKLAQLNLDNIHDYSDDWTDFSDTAGMLYGLDLLISIDSSPVHLAGAIGKSVWILFPAAPERKWGLSGEKTDWYPTARIFRQPRTHEWGPVIQRVREELLKLRDHL